VGKRFGGLRRDAVDREKRAASERGLAPNLLPEDIEVIDTARVLVPLGLQQVDLVVELERAVDLLPDDPKRFTWGKLVQGEQAIQNDLDDQRLKGAAPEFQGALQEGAESGILAATRPEGTDASLLRDALERDVPLPAPMT
jgi:hypothetical protein